MHGLLTDSLASYYFTLGAAVRRWPGWMSIMYDLRGHGRSGRPVDRLHGSRSNIDDLAGLLDALEVTRPVHLVGNSYGGRIAFGLAAAEPERVASVIAIEAEPPVKAWSERLGEGLAKAKPWLATDEAIDLITEARGSHEARLSKAASKLLQQTTIAEDVFVSRTIDDGLADVRCPVLAVYGDESVLMEQVDHLRAQLAECRVVVLPEQGHSVLIERTAEVSAQVLDWIRSLSLVEVE